MQYAAVVLPFVIAAAGTYLYFRNIRRHVDRINAALALHVRRTYQEDVCPK